MFTELFLIKKIVYLIGIFFFVILCSATFCCYSSTFKPPVKSQINIDEQSVFMEIINKIPNSLKDELNNKYLDFNIPIKDGDSLWKILLDSKINPDIANNIIKAVKIIHNPIKLYSGKNINIRILKDNNGSHYPVSIFWPILENKFIVVDSNGIDKKYYAKYVNKILRRQIYAANAIIDYTLSKTINNLGLSNNMTQRLMEMFSDKINFSREIKYGNSFDLLFERYLDENDHYVKDGDILFANIKTDKKSIASYLFMNEKGITTYYDCNGFPVKKELTTFPVKKSRISSGFGMRIHPIQKKYKMHKGIDFAAPIGSPVYATSEGIISFVGYNKSYGKYIKITHDHLYTTLYAHLNGVQNNIKKGVKVQQNQLIGFVGKTGCVTGPHLHYEVIRDNINIDPMKVTFLNKYTKLNDVEMEKFKQVMNNYDILRSTVPKLITVMN